MGSKRQISRSGLLLADGPWLKLVGAKGSSQQLVAPSSFRRLINHQVTVRGKLDVSGVFIVTDVRTG
jgi:hypothetical protein